MHTATAQVPNILASLNTPQPHAAAQSQTQHTAPLTASRSYHPPPSKQVNFAASANLKPSHSHSQFQHQYQRSSLSVDPQAQAMSPTVLDYPDSPAVCQLPGCEEYAHIDANGDVSEYCSQAHREYVYGSLNLCLSTARTLIMPSSYLLTGRRWIRGSSMLALSASSCRRVRLTTSVAGRAGRKLYTKEFPFLLRVCPHHVRCFSDSGLSVYPYAHIYLYQSVLDNPSPTYCIFAERIPLFRVCLRIRTQEIMYILSVLHYVGAARVH